MSTGICSAMEIIRGLPNAVSLLILARLPLSLHALLRRVCKAWRDALQPSSSMNAIMIRKTLHISETWVLFPVRDVYDLSGFVIADPAIGHRHDLIISSSPWLYCSNRDLCKLPPIVRGSEVLITSALSSDNKRLHCFDAIAMHMQENPSLFLPAGYITHYATAALDGCAYVAGGVKDGMVTKSVYRLNRMAKAWQVLPDMHEERRHAAAVVLHGKLCVIGGYKHNGAGQYSGEVWDPCSGTWTLIPELWPAQFFKASRIIVAVVKNKLYALRRNNGRHSDVYEIMNYDDTTKSWSSRGLLAVRSICNNDLKGFIFCQALGIGDQLAVIVYGELTSITILTTTPTLMKPLSWKCFSLPINGVGCEYFIPTAIAVHV